MELESFRRAVSLASVTWFTKLTEHVFSHSECGSRLYPWVQIVITVLGDEEIQRSGAPDRWLAEHLQGMPQLVADGRHHFAGRSSWVDDDPQNPVRLRNCHLQSQAGSHATASPGFDIYDAVCRSDSVDQAPERGRLIDGPRDERGDSRVSRTDPRYRARVRRRNRRFGRMYLGGEPHCIQCRQRQNHT